MGSLAWLLAWRGILHFPEGEFWVCPIGLFEDAVAVHQIMHGAQETAPPQKQEIDYTGDAVWEIP